MKLSCPRMLVLLGYIVCLGMIANTNNFLVDAVTLERFSDFDIEEQLKIVNKPATKIIKSVHGDTYGCVDFYKQPAFDHTSMKNHSLYYEMHRISCLKGSRANTNFGYLWENGIGCPIGTVPIKRITKDDLLRLNPFSEEYWPQGSWNFYSNQSNVDNNLRHFAISRTKRGQAKTYNGASMILAINNPKVKPPQFSSARMHVQFGDDDFIHIGWTVNPKLYSDSKTRTYVFTKAGDHQCYNSICPAGIVHTHSVIPLGLVLDHTCVRGGYNIYTNIYGVRKDEKNGNWWLKFEGVEIGFWPGHQFKQSFANYVEWGGEVYTANLPSPEMGNGHFPVKHERYDAIIYNLTTLNEKFEIDDRVTNTEAFSDNTHGYKVIDDIHSQFRVKHMIHFGGPGNMLITKH